MTLSDDDDQEPMRHTASQMRDACQRYYVMGVRDAERMMRRRGFGNAADLLKPLIITADKFYAAS